MLQMKIRPPAASSGVERCRRFGRPPFGYPPRLPLAPKAGALGAPVRSGLRQNRAGFLEKRDKWRTPGYFGQGSKRSPRYTSPLKWPTRQSLDFFLSRMTKSV